MRHLLKGFSLGLVAGILLGWLYRKWLFPAQEAVIPAIPYQARPEFAEEKPPDDLTVLRGIGPAFARRLYQAGIQHYAQLAGMTPEQLSEISGGSVERIRRDDWVGQAVALMG